MTAANHILTGSLIAFAVKQPAYAIPLSFASHFVLDSLPHFGWHEQGFGALLKHKLTYFVEFLGLLGIVFLAATGIFGWNLVTLCALIAVSPDLSWVYRYVFYERRHKKPPDTFLTTFHRRIQWCERPWGALVEIIFFVGFFALLTERYL